MSIVTPAREDQERVSMSLLHSGTEFEPRIGVHFQEVDSGPTDIGLAGDFRADERKMLAPNIRSRIK